MQSEKFIVNLILCKTGKMVYFSQLDLIHVLERALRRTKLPLYYTQGFNPRVKISFLSGLKLGIEGSIDIRLYFSENVSKSQITQQLGQQLPEGLNILGSKNNN